MARERRTTRSAIALVTLLSMVACALPKHEMREAFNESLHNAKGRTLKSLRYDQARAFIGSREPSEVRRLGNGNIVHVYHDFWAQIGVDREECTVFLELDSSSMTVVKAYAEGRGCYAAY